jgi:hypothetical protein
MPTTKFTITRTRFIRETASFDVEVGEEIADALREDPRSPQMTAFVTDQVMSMASREGWRSADEGVSAVEYEVDVPRKPRELDPNRNVALAESGEGSKGVIGSKRLSA